MIDIETLSITPNAQITNIGAIKFSRYKDIEPYHDLKQTYYCRIDLKSCHGFDIDKQTVRWWKEQPLESRNEIFEQKDRISLREALLGLSNFIGNSCETVWANSPNFDIVILENAYTKCGLEIPWKFWSLRDCRTVYDLGRTSLKDITTTKHNALHDCYCQILCLQLALRNVRGWLEI